jgi:tRNA A-37 threonylcarbamoyl transferase component Bud32
MDTIRICQQCQQPLPENAPEGLCPQCLAKVALGSEPATPRATININQLAGQAVSANRVAPDPAQLAAQFPQLEIIELLGMGGMGMVYKARQPRLDRLVALKILPVESQQHPSFAERFGREAKALAKLNHPGIVNVYDFGQTGQYYYFVMEYVDGMNLRQLLNDGTVTPRQALEIVVQICTALQYAHDKGVVHRDIKPENILINKEGQVKIADFGLAKLLGTAPDTALTMSQAAMGTLNYMAPEQRQNAQSVDHRADIYSLGVVFYEMLTGEVPMGRFEPPSKRVQVDVRLDEVVLRALEREPARRYQQASEVKSGVEAITSAGPEAPPAPPATSAMPDASKRAVANWLLRTFGLFFLGWLVTGWLWNFRTPGCWLASGGMAFLAIWVSLRRMKFFPEQWDAYSKLTVSKRILALISNFVGLTLGFFLLCGALFSFWVTGSIFTNPAARTAEQFEAQYMGKEYHLVQGLSAFSKDIPNIMEMIPDNSGFNSGFHIGWGAEAPFHHVYHAVPNLIVGSGLLFWFTLGIHGGWRKLGKTTMPTMPMAYLRPYARASLSICGSVLLMSLLVGEFNMLAHLQSFGAMVTDHRSFTCRTNIDAVTQAIEKWAGNNGYAMGDQPRWNVNTVPMGKLIGKARLLEAWKPSPFDRWRSTGFSFRCVSPRLAFELVSSENPVETHLTITGAMDCTKDQVSKGTCHRIPEDLISVLDKLESASGQAPGGNNTHSTKDQ